MTMLVTDRRRSFGMREEPHEQDPGQGSLFGPDSLAPPARPPGPTPDPFAPSRPTAAPERSATAPEPSAAEATAPVAADAPSAYAMASLAADAPSAYAPAGDLLAAAPAPPEVIEPADYLEDPAELEPAHAHATAVRSLLAGPTLDDIMSRAWEGLRAEVPTPCPVCRTEIEPSAGGRCGTCGSTLD